MPGPTPSPDPTELRLRALARWDNEGGAITGVAPEGQVELPQMSNTEMVQLRIRVIALENLLIAVLAEGTDRQLQVAQDMADFITPRPGATPHPLTIHGAHHMNDLVKRAVHYRTKTPE